MLYCTIINKKQLYIYMLYCTIINKKQLYIYIYMLYSFIVSLFKKTSHAYHYQQDEHVVNIHIETNIMFSPWLSHNLVLTYFHNIIFGEKHILSFQISAKKKISNLH